MICTGRGIIIHAVSIESNHYHMVITDLEGKLSEFIQELNRSAARCLLAYYRQRFPELRIDAIWSAAHSFSAPLLLTRNAILDKLVYTFTNPVKDGLVRDYRKWPGFNTRPSDWARGERTVARPDFYFKNTPKVLTYRVERPAQLDGDLDTVIASVETQILDRQRQAATDLAAQGRSVLGVKAVLATDPRDAPNTSQPRGNLNPHLAAGGDGEALRTAAKALRTFRSLYRQAWSLFKQGLQATFPGGTLLMRKRFGAACDPLDAYWCDRAFT
jgi:putative transposase